MLKFLSLQSAALLVGFLIDFVLGDPHCLPHPVAAIGKLIALFDKKLRRGESNPHDVGRGVFTVICVSVLSAVIPALLLWGAWVINPWVYFALESVMCWQLLAARQLAREAGKVEQALEQKDTEKARHAVSMIVGRDTAVLDASGICRAAVETVAENASDGVIAPLLWMLFGGAAGGFFYKSVNTMDSMLGYKNKKYYYFGKAAAKTDDVCNFLPARMAALLMIGVCPLCRLDRKNAWRIWRRDRNKHASPNAAQTESVCAGALGVRLAGDAVYGGEVYKKAFIGDALREIELQDIRRTNRLMYAASALMLLLCVVFRLAVILCL
ncbi:MAG: cobalamin biosynthesis protein CobD [Clostridia bacterium]|nr:cobalamin biosynthesis protein CobD [Clostridia bacterium]